MTDDKTQQAIVKHAFEKWAEKRWFQVLFALFCLYLMAAPIVGPIVYNEINKQNTQVAVVQGIEEQKQEEANRHRIDFEKSKQAYAAAKTILKNALLCVLKITSPKGKRKRQKQTQLFVFCLY